MSVSVSFHAQKLPGIAKGVLLGVFRIRHRYGLMFQTLGPPPKQDHVPSLKSHDTESNVEPSRS